MIFINFVLKTSKVTSNSKLISETYFKKLKFFLTLDFIILSDKESFNESKSLINSIFPITLCIFFSLFNSYNEKVFYYMFSLSIRRFSISS